VFDCACADKILHNPKLKPENAWQAHDSPAKPHVMLTIAHEFMGDNASLLRGEILSIVAITLTRLRSHSFQTHNIIPVTKSNCEICQFLGWLVAKLIHLSFFFK
jgi:hypothetical protein